MNILTAVLSFLKGLFVKPTVSTLLKELSTCLLTKTLTSDPLEISKLEQKIEVLSKALAAAGIEVPNSVEKADELLTKHK